MGAKYQKLSYWSVIFLNLFFFLRRYYFKFSSFIGSKPICIHTWSPRSRTREHFTSTSTYKIGNSRNKKENSICWVFHESMQVRQKLIQWLYYFLFSSFFSSVSSGIHLKSLKSTVTRNAAGVKLYIMST